MEYSKCHICIVIASEDVIEFVSSNVDDDNFPSYKITYWSVVYVISDVVGG